MTTGRAKAEAREGQKPTESLVSILDRREDL